MGNEQYHKQDPEIIRYRKAIAEGRKTVLFVCSGNAVRSQMAEALVNHFLRTTWSAFSAGTLKTAVHPLVKKVMAEIGIDMASQTSKSIETFNGCRFDKVITLCAEADEVCTYVPGLREKEHIPFLDPSLSYNLFFGGKALFRKLSNEMKDKIIPLLEKV
jgi:arsenate reductase (thioredoxin)